MEPDLSDIKKAILKVAKIRTNVCEYFEADLKRCRTLKDFERFIDDWFDDIDDRLKWREISVADVISPSNIEEWFNSPFVSEFDKSQVLDKIKKQLTQHN